MLPDFSLVQSNLASPTFYRVRDPEYPNRGIHNPSSSGSVWQNAARLPGPAKFSPASPAPRGKLKLRSKVARPPGRHIWPAAGRRSPPQNENPLSLSLSLSLSLQSHQPFRSLSNFLSHPSFKKSGTVIYFSRSAALS